MTDGSPRRVLLRVLLSVPVLAAALWLVFHRTHPQALAAAFARLDVGWSLASLAAMLAVTAVRLMRWGLLVEAVADVPRPTIGRVGLIGAMAIDVLPVRSGELVRPLFLRRQAGVPFGAGMATCVVERVLDLLALLLLLLATLALADLPSLVVTVFDRPVDVAVQGRNAVLAAVLFFGLPGVLLVLAGNRGEAALHLAVRPLPEALRRPLVSLSLAYRDGTRAIGKPVLLLQAGALTCAGWVLNVLVQWALMEAFGLSGYDFWQVGFLTVVVAVALMLPSPAGGLGVFEAGAVAGLLLFAVDPSLAAALAVALHAVHTGTFVLLGGIALAAEGLRFSDLWRAGPAAP